MRFWLMRIGADRFPRVFGLVRVPGLFQVVSWEHPLKTFGYALWTIRDNLLSFGDGFRKILILVLILVSRGAQRFS